MTKENDIMAAKKIVGIISRSPTQFHVTDTASRMLDEKGFTRLMEDREWPSLSPGGYYVTRDGSSLIAFTIPECGDSFTSFRIIASHGDSPALKIKENPELEGDGLIRLNVEGYGGLLCHPWFDRPLSVAGRIVVRDNGAFRSIIVDLEEPLIAIPSLAIHMDRNANDGRKINMQADMLPVFGDSEDKGKLLGMVAETAGVNAADILGADLYAYVSEPATFWGARKQFFSSPRIDDQECTWCCLDGFLTAYGADNILMHCIFDNEEVGSRTRRGAAGTFLSDTMERIGLRMGIGRERMLMAMSKSVMISADNAHAVHPAHGDKSDPVNRPRMNGGIVLKHNAGQKYTTDALTAAMVRAVCEDAGIPLQNFVNRSDQAGGSTLGNLAITQVPIACADIGLAQLAMHSPYETSGTFDVSHLIRFSREFYSSEISEKFCV